MGERRCLWRVNVGSMAATNDTPRHNFSGCFFLEPGGNHQFKPFEVCETGDIDEVVACITSKANDMRSLLKQR